MSFNNPKKYDEYMKNPLDMGEINRIYESNKINANRADIYFDYVISLCNEIFSTYMGDEYYDVDDKISHFDWCWNKNTAHYNDMGYEFKQTEKDYLYFLSFFTDLYYFLDNKNWNLEEDVIMIWEYIFNYNMVKPKKDVYNFIDIYNMFDNSKWYENGKNNDTGE